MQIPTQSLQKDNKVNGVNATTYVCDITAIICHILEDHRRGGWSEKIKECAFTLLHGKKLNVTVL